MILETLGNQNLGDILKATLRGGLWQDYLYLLGSVGPLLGLGRVWTLTLSLLTPSHSIRVSTIPQRRLGLSLGATKQTGVLQRASIFCNSSSFWSGCRDHRDNKEAVTDPEGQEDLSFPAVAP